MLAPHAFLLSTQTAAQVHHYPENRVVLWGAGDAAGVPGQVPLHCVAVGACLFMGAMSPKANPKHYCYMWGPILVYNHAHNTIEICMYSYYLANTKQRGGGLKCMA